MSGEKFDSVCVARQQDSVIATDSDPTKPQTVQRKHKDGTSHTYPCPSTIADYNRYMGGVDSNDQLRGYYHVRLKCRKY